MACKLVIFTDLDGSLLDHFTYSFKPAIALLDRLEQLRIPVVFTTSKTSSEVLHLRKRMGNHHPFIVENGAGIYIPENYFTSSIQDVDKSQGCLVKSFVQSHKHWFQLLERVDRKYHGHYKIFSRLSEKELSELTGLSVDEARRAQQRDFGEPVWWQGDDTMKQGFIEELESLGAHVLHGGRFLHVSGDCDKGRALTWLSNLYSSEYKREVISIAAGDSGNDVAMLEAANISLIVRSPVHSPPVLDKGSEVFLSTLNGPKGWAEGIEQILSQYSSKL